jgi:hypothetical protein
LASSANLPIDEISFRYSFLLSFKTPNSDVALLLRTIYG